MHKPVVGTTYWIGMQFFTAGIKLNEDGTADLQVASILPDGTQHTLKGQHDPMIVLAELAQHWPVIAGIHGGAGKGRHDIGRTMTGQNEGQMLMVWENKRLRIVGMHRDALHLNGDSVIPVEILATFGDFIAQIAPADLEATWQQARAATDLPPFEIKDRDWNDVGASDEEIAAWYAGKLGIDPETFVNGAIMLHAQHMLWATKGDGLEATRERQNPYTWAAVDAETAKAAAVLAAERLSEKVDDVIASAIGGACGEARAVVVFGAKAWKRDEASTAPSL